MKTMLAMLALLVLTVVSPCVLGYSSFQSQIPNGNLVRDPCDGKTIWQGVGHQAMGGSGPRNPFGLDFYNNGKKWDRTLCEMDSDGDGVTNGAELGDPLCVWTPGGSDPSDSPSGHPGLCEPWSDPMCLDKNTFHTCQAGELQCDAINSPDVKNFTVRFPKTQVPADETTYICMNFAFPADQDYHIIADTGVIDNGYVMHHTLIYACDASELSDLVNPLNTPYICGMSGERKCQDIIGMWSVGIPGFCHNENAGFRIGLTGYKYASIQFHWNNPSKRSDYEDSSGMTMFYTPVLRPYNLGNLMIGENQFRIPPGESRYVIESECSSTCSDRIMTSSVYAVSGINHMHYMGRAMTTYHTPAGGSEQAIMEDPHYSYDNPAVHVFETPLEIKKGDVLKAKCSFTSSRKNVTTFSGEATSEEMCFGFLFYYPKESIQSSQCTTMMGLPACSINHETDIIDGCQIKSFMENTQYFQGIFTEIAQRCETFICRKECKTYIKELRLNPCLQGKVSDYVERVLSYYVGVNEMALYHSCDTEIALEVAECTCTTEAPRPCVEYTGTAVSHQASFYLLLSVVMATIYSK